jgi:hypothetical protein
MTTMKKQKQMYVYSICNALNGATAFCNRRPRKAELRQLAKSEFGWDDERFDEEFAGFNLVVEKVRVNILKEGQP